MNNLFSMLVVFAHIRTLAWLCFFMFLYSCLVATTEVRVALEGRAPWETIYDALGLLNAVRALLLPLLFGLTSYFGYRCIMNEYDDSAVELNRLMQR
jgi:hypothetical protein